MRKTPRTRRYVGRGFVHSEFALGMLTADRGDEAQYAPGSVLLFGVRGVAVDTRVRGAASRPPLIVSLGVVAEVKGLASLISSNVRLQHRAHRSRATLVTRLRCASRAGSSVG